MRSQYFATRLVSGAGLLLAMGVVGMGWVGMLWHWDTPSWGVDQVWAWAMVIYGVNSAVTFLVYGYDKGAAQAEKWRIPETTLHSLEFLGGWPGALLAQQFFRHKRRKPGYLLALGLIILSHVIGWGWCIWVWA